MFCKQNVLLRLHLNAFKNSNDSHVNFKPHTAEGVTNYLNGFFSHLMCDM